MIYNLNFNFIMFQYHQFMFLCTDWKRKRNYSLIKYLFIVDLGYCSPFDNNEVDCQNGQCAIYKDQYGSFQTICRCKSGYYGEKCDSKLFSLVFLFNHNSKNGTQRYNKVFNLMKDRDDIRNLSQRKL